MSSAPKSGETAALDDATLEPGTYRVGTLAYTKIGLFTLFFWMLWGDFVYMLMESVVPVILPLQLKALDASDTYIALLAAVIPSALNFMVNPVVSFRSDRYRSRWGRRIPFLLWSTPFVSMFLVLLAFAPQFGAVIGRTGFSSGLTTATITLGLIGVLVVGFQFTNMILSSVYYYLFNDVVPQQFMGRFMAMFRIVGQLAGAFFSYFLVPHAETYAREIYLGAAGLYFVGFMLMCWRVKEGEYPPPPPHIGGRTGILAAAQTYFRECFTHPFYVAFFLCNALLQATIAVHAFNLLFLKSVNVDLETVGKITSVFILAGTPLILLGGIAVDRFGAVPLYFISITANLVLSILSFFFLVDKMTWIIFGAAIVPITSMRIAAQMPFYYAMLPKDRFGQFASADAMARSLVTVIAGLLAGICMDLAKRFYDGEDYYRVMFAWQAICYVGALGCLFVLYRYWRRAGGGTPQGYQPPGAGSV